MAKFNLKEFATDAIMPAALINVAGFIEPKVEDYLSGAKNTGALNMLNSSAVYNKGGASAAKNAKWYKVLLYTGIGLAAQAGLSTVDGKMADHAGRAVGLLMYGLSGATIAEDPVLNVASPVYRQVGNPQGGMPSAQVVTRTANVIS
jgi:hypothetical protein